MSGSKIIKQCKHCGRDFESYGSQKKAFCSVSCRCTFVNKARAKEKAKKECLICHKHFTPYTDKTKYCSNRCRGIARRTPASEKKQYIPKEPRIKICGVCGAEFIAQKAAKFCLSCRESEKLKYARAYWQTEKYKEAHRRRAIEWQKSNPMKAKAQYLAKKYPDNLNIIYECPHKMEGKHRHHYDYCKPFDVLILCDQCHIAEHKRLRNLADSSAIAPPVTDSRKAVNL